MGEEDGPDRSRTIAGYDILADRSETLDVSPWGDSDYQNHYVWPGVRPLLPEVTDARVLDAGCGVGDHTGWFLENGAAVVGVDASEQALTRARSRFGDRATFHRADLTEPLDFADADAFDLVFCNLVLDHVENWRPVLDEFNRVLTAAGLLVVTTIHPMRRYRLYRDDLTSYYATEAYVKNWGGTGARIETYHRPIGAIVNSLRDTGFAIDEFREPRPQREYESCNPDRYERAMRRPDLLCIRAGVRGSE